MTNTDSIIQEISAKSILVDSKLPDTDYVINPYTGCAFACSYCYASFMGRFVGKDIKDWGKYVFVKRNLPEILENELANLKNTDKTVFLSSVTDPYQGVEAKYELTRSALGLLEKYNWQGVVGVLTKSPLVTRDIDMFKKIENIEVGLTITSTDDDISRFFEVNAPPVSLRFKALKTLNEHGIKTYAFVGPLFPHYLETPEKLEEIFKTIKEVGTKELYVEQLNLSTYIRTRLVNYLKTKNPEFLEKYYLKKSKLIDDALNELVVGFIKKYNLQLRLNEVITHDQLPLH